MKKKIKGREDKTMERKDIQVGLYHAQEVRPS